MNKGNALHHKGMLGQLLVQLRLIQFGIEAAMPLTDSGNDLIAVLGKKFQAIQVKTRTTEKFSCGELPRNYHLLAIVHLIKGDEEHTANLEKSKIYLIDEPSLRDGWRPTSFNGLEKFLLTKDRVVALFEGHPEALWDQVRDNDRSPDTRVEVYPE